ncbi:MAG: hypothetical protein KatS3mg002_0611 [Candidatus Woesearchaeota archaeon]|nr:MAG: hypothetical protein KatS3mg002_0611 [Candidatus Woesearchaeota archaeon]
MLSLSQSLSYYKRKDIQELLLKYSKEKEIAVRYNNFFGKRPDTLTYPNDILECAKKGATSFHCSEELWTNPLQLNPNMRKNEMDELRKGWDLILDIDCPYWKFSKLATYVFIKALKEHGIESVTVKFSGSKGFHIAVPFEAFPEKKYYINGNYYYVKDLFPEAPRRIAEYLVNYVNKHLIKISDDTIFFGKISIPISKLLSETKTSKDEAILLKCNNCDNIVNKSQEEKFQYICSNCETVIEDRDVSFMLCPKCKKIMKKYPLNRQLCSCGSNSVRSEFDLSKIVAVDTVLISSRHLYRMPYSLHEKTGLVSVPFDIKRILKFEKNEAIPSKVKPYPFLERELCKKGEADILFQKAFDFSSEKNIQSVKKAENKPLFFDDKSQAISEEHFPPCIKKISLGLEDGKKRALLVLINFLYSCNWTYEMIEEYIMKWNERNKPDKLRETYIKGQLRYHKMQKEKMLPPNCNNKGYMIDTQFCNPDEFCKKIKNPVQYSKKKVWLLNQNSGKKKRVKNKEVKKT